MSYDDGPTQPDRPSWSCSQGLGQTQAPQPQIVFECPRPSRPYQRFDIPVDTEVHEYGKSRHIIFKPGNEFRSWNQGTPFKPRRYKFVREQLSPDSSRPETRRGTAKPTSTRSNIRSKSGRSYQTLRSKADTPADDTINFPSHAVDESFPLSGSIRHSTTLEQTSQRDDFTQQQWPPTMPQISHSMAEQHQVDEICVYPPNGQSYGFFQQLVSTMPTSQADNFAVDQPDRWPPITSNGWTQVSPQDTGWVAACEPGGWANASQQTYHRCDQQLYNETSLAIDMIADQYWCSRTCHRQPNSIMTFNGDRPLLDGPAGL